MDEPVETTDALGAELEGLVSQIERHCQVIAEQLRRPPPHKSARIIASANEITRLVRAFFSFLQRLTRAQREETERQRAIEGGRGTLPLAWHRLNARVGSVRLWLNLWPGLQRMVNDQMLGRRRKLYQRRPKAAEIAQTQVDIADSLLDQLHRVLNPRSQTERARERGCFEDIAMPTSRFLEHAHAAYRVLLAMRKARPRSILDVGCGGGLTLLTALGFFDQATGVEFDAGYAASARRLIRKAATEACRVVQTDALTFKHYGAFDVVYVYRPMRDPASMVRLEQRIIERVPPRTLLIAPYVAFDQRHGDYQCPRVDGSVYLAKSTKAEATRLRRLAELTGACVDTPREGLPTIWEPLLAASHANGFAVARERPLLTA